MICAEKETQARWASDFEELLNYSSATQPLEATVRLIDKQPVDIQILKMKNQPSRARKIKKHPVPQADLQYLGLPHAQPKCVSILSTTENKV